MTSAHRRKPTNVSLDPVLLAEAQQMGINLSRVLEERLKDVVKAERQRRWLEENRKGIEAMNAFVDRNGVFNEEDREW